MKTLHRILAVAAVLAISFASLAHGQTTIVVSSTAPSTTSTDIVNFVSDGSIGSDFSNNKDGAGEPPGQTFTTLSALGGYDLTAVTVKGGGSAGFGAGEPLTLDIYSLSGTPTNGKTLTTLVSQEFAFTSPEEADGTSYKTDYLTLDLTTPIVLAPDTEYAFTIGNSFNNGSESNQSAYYGFEDSSNYSPSTENTYSGGTAFIGSSPTGTPGDSSATIASTEGYDMSFAIDLEDAPEPSTWAMMFGGAAMLLGLLCFRRRAF